jgi:hypothetical protein
MWVKKIFVFVAVFIFCKLGAQTKIPTIEEVADKFYNTYDIRVLDYPAVGFEKRKNGWTVTTKIVEHGELVNEKSYLMYDASIAVYYQLPITKRADDYKVDYRNYVDDYQIRNYHLHLFYGYAGWYKDVINEYSNEATLTDSALYSLARAYSMYASSLLNNQGGEAVKAEIFQLPLNNNCLNKQQLDLYNAIAQKSIQTFKKLQEQNSLFESPVGKIAIKYANEVMVQFHTYLTYSNQQANNFELPNHLYGDSIVNQIKLQLAACPQNAVLLSFGDNDFYPVLYVQHKLGVRKDVYVINESLLGLDRYIFSATQPQLNSTGIQISLDTNFYKGVKNDYFFLELNDSTMRFKDIIQLIKTKSLVKQDALKLPANYFTFKKETATIELQFNVPFLAKSNWIIMDILYNLKGRKFCITNKFYRPLDGLNKYFIEVDDIGVRVL